MLIQELQLRGLLSYGPESPRISLLPLNVIIGANGSGKSNLIEAIAMLQSAPSELSRPIRESGGGTQEWLWKGPKSRGIAELEFVFSPPPHEELRLLFETSFMLRGQRFAVGRERIEFPDTRTEQPYYVDENGFQILTAWPPARNPEPSNFERQRLMPEELDPTRSILAQRRDPKIYPQITYLADALPEIRIYRDWTFGPKAPCRAAQPVDLPSNWLLPDASNLGLVLNRLKDTFSVKERLLKHLRDVYDEAKDFNLSIFGNRAQLSIQEEDRTVPASRLSDGVLRYLSLAAILLDPTPPPLICIDEPELGLHIDMLNNIADLLKEAASRTQLIVTTHSDLLVDNFHREPETIIICEKRNGSTHLERLDREQMSVWLEKYRLGDLWVSGEIGGKRW